jgi:hypothetical protein
MADPRIADDFAAIRARLEELRREREQMRSDDGEKKPQNVTEPFRWFASGDRNITQDRLLPRSLVRKIPG